QDRAAATTRLEATLRSTRPPRPSPRGAVATSAPREREARGAAAPAPAGRRRAPLPRSRAAAASVAEPRQASRLAPGSAAGAGPWPTAPARPELSVSRPAVPPMAPETEG